MSTRVLHSAFVVTDELRARFYSKTITASSGCLIWTGCVQRNSYGGFKIDGKKIDAHVASWRISQGGIAVPIGKLVMHKCDCRMCVSPKHLRLGTQRQNMKHAFENDRGDDFHPRGEDVPNAVLTVDMVRRVRTAYAMPGMSQRKVAAALGLRYPLVRAVLEHKRWNHVD